MAAVVDHFLQGRGPVRSQEVARRTGADPRHVVATLDALVNAGLLAEVGAADDPRFVPARPPESVRAAEVLRAWRRTCAAELGHPGPAEAALSAGLQAVEQALAMPIDTLVRSPRRRDNE